MISAAFLRVNGPTISLRRYLNCWTAAITKKHRTVYELTYPTLLVLSDGSSIEINYHEPRKIITLPLDLAELTEQQQKARLAMRKPKSKVIMTDDFEDTFDENKYLNLKM